MIEFRPIVFILGVMLAVLAAAMLLPALADYAAGFTGDAANFAISAAATLFIGISAMLASRGRPIHLDIRQMFVAAVLGWTVAAAFAAIPFLMSDLGLDAAAAYFEAMAGVTTTAADSFVGLDSAPPGILLWRALLQWMGGMATIAMAIAMLPVLRIGGMQLFQIESAERARALPAAAQIVASAGLIYVVLTAVCATALWVTGMTGFEAVLHAMATVSNGGFSTSDQSIAHFRSTAIELVLILFMILSSLPMVLYLQALRGNPKRLVTDSQVLGFLAALAAAVALIAAWEWGAGEDLGDALDMSAFNVVSIITGTGFTTTDYSEWGGLTLVAFLFFMVIGGCAGSAASGIKIFRFQVIAAAADAQIRRLIQPSGVFLPYVGGRPVPEAVAASVTGFFFLFAVSFAAITLALTAIGIALVPSISGAAAAIANVGPGLGPVIGPEGAYNVLPASAQWILSFAMLLGRLELVPLMVLLVPAFWRG